MQEIKAEIASQLPGIPGEVFDAAFTLAVGKMMDYEKAKIPQEKEYILLLFLDCLHAILNESLTMDRAREAREEGVLMKRYHYQCRVCKECNRPLDPDERCDCQKEKEPLRKEENEKAAYLCVGERDQ